jgi:hypothetical protein
VRKALAIAIVLLLPPTVAVAWVTPSYQEQAQQEIEQYRKLKLLEKQTEVIARLQQMNAPVTNNTTVSNTSLHSSNKNTSRTETVQNTRVKNG